jgi:hypothetical protein
VGELRRPGQQAGAEPGEEVEQGLAGEETGDEPVLQQQSGGEGDAEQVVIMQVGGGEGREDEQRRGGPDF